MRNYFKILVATDYSSTGVNAERYAIQLAKATNSYLIFFHAFEVPFHYSETLADFEKIDENPVKLELTDLKQHVDELLKSMEIRKGEVEYRCIVRQDSLAEELHTEAEYNNIDFIIMGTHEPYILQSILQTSHTWGVIKNAEIPVLAIPEEAAFDDIKHIVLATEYRKGEIPVIKFLITIAMHFDADLTILHVYNDVFSNEFENEIFAIFREEVKSVVDYDKLEIHLIHNNNLIEGLNRFCINAKANWLVMSHEKASFLISLINPVSVTKKMCFHTHVPLFTVPDKYKPKDIKDTTIQGNGHSAMINYNDFFAGSC
ncbi:MAG: universal stress protein [Bacteroidia bacterium]